jgi:hypothetical protein
MTGTVTGAMPATMPATMPAIMPAIMTALPTSLAGLLEQHAQAALQISRAGQTAWNGEVVEAGEGILGLAHWDGTLHLDRECVLDPLQEMYERSGEPRSDADLVRCREALVTLLHEQSHFLGPAGATQEAARSAFKLPGSRPLEEGVAEAWAHDHLNDYLRQLGIDKVAPGITEVRSEASYAAFVPAVRLFAADLDRRAGLPAGGSLNLLSNQTAEGQWGTAVDLIYSSSRLPDVVPPDREPTVRLHLERTLRDAFWALETYEPSPRSLASSRSHAAGSRILSHVQKELTIAEHSIQPAPATAAGISPAAASRTSAEAAHQQPQVALRHALSGLAPPTEPHQATPVATSSLPANPEGHRSAMHQSAMHQSASRHPATTTQRTHPVDRG